MKRPAVCTLGEKPVPVKQEKAPTRVSVNAKDKGYVQNPFDYEVYLNGTLVCNCITADEIERFVVCYKTDRNGKLVPAPNGEIVGVTRFGTVKILKVR